MYRNRLPWVIGICVLGALGGCSRTLLPPEPSLATYYPLTVGKSRTYSVVDSTYTTTGAVRAVYDLRESYTGTGVDVLGVPTTAIGIDTASAGQVFTPAYSGTAQRTTSLATLTLGNERLALLSYPAARGAIWRGYETSTAGDTARFRYLSVDTTMTIRGRRFEKCWLIRQRIVTGFQTREVFTIEAFAPGIGKVLRYDKYLIYEILPNGSRRLTTESRVYREELLSTTF
jgi:hypothetical protein